VGVESGSDRTKKEGFKRPMTNAQVLRAAKIINRHPHVIPYYFLIIGNPCEREQDLIETIRFLGELPAPYFLRTYNLVFLPNTLLYEMAVADKNYFWWKRLRLSVGLPGRFEHTGGRVEKQKSLSQ
jgi:anaerobic magnesium-protoporphyrin IX monomethyl ester cyclase